MPLKGQRQTSPHSDPRVGITLGKDLRGPCINRPEHREPARRQRQRIALHLVQRGISRHLDHLQRCAAGVKDRRLHIAAACDHDKTAAAQRMNAGVVGGGAQQHLGRQTAGLGVVDMRNGMAIGTAKGDDITRTAPGQLLHAYLAVGLGVRADQHRRARSTGRKIRHIYRRIRCIGRHLPRQPHVALPAGGCVMQVEHIRRPRHIVETAPQNIQITAISALPHHRIAAIIGNHIRPQIRPCKGVMHLEVHPDLRARGVIAAGKNVVSAVMGRRPGDHKPAIGQGRDFAHGLGPRRVRVDGEFRQTARP